MWMIRLCTVTVFADQINNATGINPIPSPSVLLLTSSKALTADFSSFIHLFIYFTVSILPWMYVPVCVFAQDTSAGG